MKKLFAVSVKM